MSGTVQVGAATKELSAIEKWKPSVPRKLAAADLSARAFIRATRLVEQLLAENPDMPFTKTCQQTGPQAHTKDCERRPKELDATFRDPRPEMLVLSLARRGEACNACDEQAA